jgi:hypothetical protein
MTPVAADELMLCARHVDKQAIGTCARCGTYYCGDCYKDLAGRRLCASCLEIPGMDYLKDTRDAAWGKRDGWVWYFGGLMGLSTLWSMGMGVARGDVGMIVNAVAWLAVLVPYFMLMPWSRKAMFLLLPISLLQTPELPKESAAAAMSPMYLRGIQLGSLLFAALFMAAAYFDARNKLAFRIEIPESELQKMYDRRSNSTARRSLIYGLLSIFVPLLGLLTLALGISAYRRADPNAWPPVGGKRTAIFGIVISSLSSLLWISFFGFLFLKKS